MGEIADVQNPSVKYAREQGWYCRKVTYLDRRGCPDYWFFKAGKLLIVEFKRKDETPDLQQQRRHKELLAAGFKVHVIDSHSDFVALLDTADWDISHGV